jgi:hypothetical protein
VNLVPSTDQRSMGSRVRTVTGGGVENTVRRRLRPFLDKATPPARERAAEHCARALN